MEMEKRVLLILLEDYLVPLVVPDDLRSTLDVLRRRSPPDILAVPSATGNTNFSFFMGVNTSSISIEPSGVDSSSIQDIPSRSK